MTAAGWGLTATSMLTLTVIVTGVIRTINLVSEHGTITMAQLRNNASLYVGTVTRVSQNAYHM